MAKNVEKGIYMRGKYYWIRYSDGAGRVREESTKSESIKLAREIRKNRIAEACYDDLPDRIKSKDATFDKLAEKYTEAIKDTKSYKVKKYYIAGLVEILGSTKIKQLNADRVAALKKLLKETPMKDGSMRTGATVNRWMACFKHMITLANTDFAMCGRHTREMSQRVKKEPESPNREYWLNEDECARLIKAALPHIRPIIIMAIHTGLRRGSVYDLKWKDVHYDRKVCYLPDSKSNKPITVPMTEGIELLLKSMPHYGELVFCKKNGKPLGDIRKSYAKARDLAGLPSYFQLRDLRHTFATNLSIQGEDIHRISILLNHSKIEMTKRYVNDNTRQGRRAVSTLDKAIPITHDMLPMQNMVANEVFIGADI